MMNINSVDEMKMQVGQKSSFVKAADPMEKSIQNQIGNAQKQLQQLASNKEMSIEEKMKKRQEIQEQINDLNKQLRQHQIEQRKERQNNTETTSAERDMPDSSKKAGVSGLSYAGMEAMISADSAISHAKNLKSVATQMKGQKSVLAAEIEQDARRGRDVGAKQEAMEDLEDRIMKTETSQISVMGKATKEMKEAAKAEQQAGKTEKGKEKTEKKNKTELIEAGIFPEKAVVDAKKETSNPQLQLYGKKVNILL